MTPSQAEVSTKLRRYLQQNRLSDHARLPPERELASKLGVTRNRLRGVLRRMAAQGEIWRHVGKGTFIGRRPLEAAPHNGGGMVLTNAAAGASIEAVVPKLKRVRVDTLAPSKAVVGVTARTRLVFRVERADAADRRVTVVLVRFPHLAQVRLVGDEEVVQALLVVVDGLCEGNGDPLVFAALAIAQFSDQETGGWDRFCKPGPGSPPRTPPETRLPEKRRVR